METPFMYLVANNWLQKDSCGWGNGYVALPKGHKYFGVDYEEIPVEVHGGLTYAQEIDGYWVVGFDTAHLGDTKEKWTLSAVLAETKRLLSQLEE